MVTAYPFLARSPAQVSPEGPEPTTATLWPLFLGQIGYYTQDEFINIVNKVDEVDGNEDSSLDKTRFTYDELKNKEFVWYDNDIVFGEKQSIGVSHTFAYKHDSSQFTTEQKEKGLKLKVVGILEPKETINFGCLSAGIYYTDELSEYIIEKNYNSQIASHFREKEENPDGSMSTASYFYDFVYEGEEYKNNLAYVGQYNQMMGMFNPMLSYQLTSRHLGGEKVANSMYIYPADFETKDLVTAYLDKWNEEGEIVVNDKTYTLEERIETKYTDTLSLVISMINTMIDVVTYALIAFTSLSLVVSCVMISIITYVSVMERVKEIGVIRSLGGRKKDVANLFNVETLIIGAISGLFGIGVTYLLSSLVNTIVYALAGFSIMVLPLSSAVIMVLLSIALTMISGLIPSRKAAKQDPVVALRTE